MGNENRLAKCSVAEAIGRMIIDHSSGLHKGVTDNRADEFEPSTFQGLAHGIGDGRATGNVFG